MLLWKHNFYSYTQYRVNMCQLYCCICRCKLNGICFQCRNTNYWNDITKTKSLLFTLLCLQKRKDCLMSKIDKHVLTKIYTYVIKNELFCASLNSNCNLCQLECQHVFHSHCLNLWKQKINACPLDGSHLLQHENSQTIINILRTCDVSVNYKLAA